MNLASSAMSSESFTILQAMKEALEERGYYRAVNSNTKRMINVSSTRLFLGEDIPAQAYYTVSEVVINFEYDPIFDGQPGARFYKRRFFPMTEAAFFDMFMSARTRLESDDPQDVSDGRHGMTFEQAYEHSGGIIYPIHRTNGNFITRDTTPIISTKALNNGVVVILTRANAGLSAFFEAYKKANGAPCSEGNIVRRIHQYDDERVRTKKLTNTIIVQLTSLLNVQIKYEVTTRAPSVPKAIKVLTPKVPKSLNIDSDVSVDELADILNMEVMDLVHQLNRQRGGRHSRIQVFSPKDLVEYLEKFYPQIRLTKQFGLPERKTKTGSHINKVSVVDND